MNINNYVAIMVPRKDMHQTKRGEIKLVKLVKETFQKDKVVATICHGPQLLIEGNVIKGNKATCFTSVVTDLKNADGIYINQ